MSRSRCGTALIAICLLLTASRASQAQLSPTAFTSLGALNVTSGTLTINTDSLSISGAAAFTGVLQYQANGPPIAVFDFSSINIGSSATISLRGTLPLAILSQGNTTIQSNVVIAPDPINYIVVGGYPGGYFNLDGSGGPTAATGSGPGGGSAELGTGGGGFGGAGGSGSGGSPYGNLFQTLQGGSGGAANVFVSTAGSDANARGGTGGGALEIVASGNLTVAGITANGSDGSASFQGSAYAAAGGGAGGGVLLSGGSGLIVTSISVNGGNGFAGDAPANGGGGGRIVLSGISSYTLGSTTLGSGIFSPVTASLHGGNAASSGGGPGFAGIVTVDSLDTTIPSGQSLTLDGTPIISVAGSTNQSSPTIEAYIRQSAVINTGATVTLGMNNALEQLDSSGNNITEVAVGGTLNLNGFNESIDTLFGLFTSAILNIPANSTLTVGVSNSVANGGGSFFGGQLVGAGALVKAGTGILTLQTASPSFTGSTTINGGTLSITNNAVLANSTVMVSGGTLSFSSISAPVIGALAGTTNESLSGLTSFSVGGNNSSTTYSGNLSGTVSGGLIKTGIGTWILSGTNTQSGPLNVQGGTLLANSPGAISPNALITVSSGATLDLNGYNYSVMAANPINVQGALRLGGAGLSVASGATANYNGGTISNGFLQGSGTQTLTGGARLSGVTTSSSVTISQTGAASVSNFTNNGQFNNAAGQSLGWSDGTITSAGKLTIGGIVTASDFVSNGIITINGGGALNNSGSNINLGGGSRTTINSSGALSTASGTTIELNGGLLINNGTITGTTDVNYGALAMGTGSYGLVNVNQGGVYAPGNSPGIVTAAAVTFDNTAVSTGAAELQIELGGTTPGIGYDQLHVTGQLSLGGILQVSLVNGFLPVSGNSFDILDWGTLVGKFSSLQPPSLNAPLGWDTSQLYTTGVITASADLLGDINRDGKVTVADISALMEALSDFNNYLAANPDLKSDFQLLHEVVDVNGDGKINNADLQALITLIANNAASGGGQLTAVPEPATLTLSVIGLSILAMLRLRSRMPQ